ncbi:hypothetical protein [Acidianus manzaensis]|uniref:Uncharacterized protein n=1 Tax=Acidianus manzaensis TaxID=282676 RepID=A0A1W6K380_9CREN|nr:hypothetical protein [Acidianus manzaensis]ARM76960.1 hypothetical protein B6F84_13665 [Acidianus manzaensis]
MEECSYQTKGQLNKEAWIGYIKNCIVPLYVNLKAVDNFGNYLMREVSNVVDLGKIDQNLLPFFAGGINEKGEYIQGSLAKLIKGLYGIYVDPKAYLNFAQGLNYSKVGIQKIDTTTAISIIHSLVNDLEALFTKLGLVIPSVEDITNAEQFKNIIQNLENNMISILPIYNYYSFVITTTRHVLGTMLEVQYPEIFNDESLQKFLGLEKIPIYPQEKNSSIYIHKQNETADILFRTIWYSIVPQLQVKINYIDFMNSILKSNNLVVGELEDSRFKKIEIKGQDAHVLISRYPDNEINFVFYEKNYDIGSLFKDNKVNIILFLDPSLTIQTTSENEVFKFIGEKSLWERFDTGSEISPSKILSQP